VEGTPFGRYQLLEVLGRGGMGEVWRAHDTAMDRVVAIKMLLPHFATDPDYDKRFRREARAAARLADPHVVPIYDVGEIDGRLYVAMRLVSGIDLQSMLAAGPLEPNRAVHVVEQIASALHTAHQAGLVHRDVKPSNILVTPNDFAYLIDFGIARAASDTALTAADTTVGTWAYMAPERFRSGDADPSGDVYALACVLYQCLTGEPPFPGEALEQVAVGHMLAPPPQPSADHDAIPTALDQVIATGLAKLPADRYPSALEMATAARQAITDHVTSPTLRVPPAAERTRTSPRYAGVMPPVDPAYAVGLAVPPPQPPAPFGGPPPSIGKPSWRRPGVLIGALVAVAALFAAGAFAAVKFSQRESPGTPTTSSNTAAADSSGAAPNTGPFTGLYRVDFGPITDLDGVGDPNAKPSVATYGVRSVCRQTGCVATASRLSGDNSFAPTAEFDQVGGIWLAVTVASQECRTDPRAEVWQVFKLQPGPNGSFTGENTAGASNSCVARYTVTFTRTGEVDIESLPDPADLPPRVVSPAEALYGHYRQEQTFTNGQKFNADYSVVTDCLRTGERCMSYFHESSGLALPLVFADGQWTRIRDVDNTCPGVGGATHVKTTGIYPMPQPPQNPIALLSGHGAQAQTSPCPVNIEFDETFTRTGS
jgi:serine/threonine protein kinase